MQFKIISCEALEQYLARSDVLLLDLRSREEYDRGHIRGAVFADWETLEQTLPSLLDSLPKQPQHIILYCDRGNISLLKARDLARAGYPVMSLNGGYAYWTAYLARQSSG